MSGYVATIWIVYLLRAGTLEPVNGFPEFTSAEACETFRARITYADKAVCWPKIVEVE
jgi:hypothetical protein